MFIYGGIFTIINYFSYLPNIIILNGRLTCKYNQKLRCPSRYSLIKWAVWILRLSIKDFLPYWQTVLRAIFLIYARKTDAKQLNHREMRITLGLVLIDHILSSKWIYKIFILSILDNIILKNNLKTKFFLSWIKYLISTSSLIIYFFTYTHASLFFLSCYDFNLYSQ